MPPRRADILIIGAGAAGLFAAIHAGRTLRAAGKSARVVAVDGARRLGAKILVAGGGRCNVTHHAVDEKQYSASSLHAVRNVLGRFGVADTVAFFAERGVELKREETGKLFPVTDDAHTVLNALLDACGDAGVELLHPWRAAAVSRQDGGFAVTGAQPGGQPETLLADRLILATGGKALPRTGSDGAGYAFATLLGHTVSEVFPALVPLVVAEGHMTRQLSGLSAPVEVSVASRSGKLLKSFTNSVLCTHFGISGPAALDISRFWTAAHHAGGAMLRINWLAGTAAAELDRLLVGAKGMSIARWLMEQAPHGAEVPGHASRGMPERLARALCSQAGVDGSSQVNTLTKVQRAALVGEVCGQPLPVVGDRGFTHAEVTAGGVPLGEVRLDTMESRVCPGLHLCGEILDVDGRVGGFNFQWAWASGAIAGKAAAEGVQSPQMPPARSVNT